MIAERVAAGFAMIVPPGWRQLHLQPEGDRSQVTETVTAALRAAGGQGSPYCALYRVATEQAVIAASVIATIVTADPDADRGGDLEALRSRVAAGRGRSPVLDAEITELPAGHAVRVHSQHAVSINGAVVPTESLQYLLPAPFSHDVLVVTFSTPTPAAGAALVPMFDAMAQSIEWLP